MGCRISEREREYEEVRRGMRSGESVGSVESMGELARMGRVVLQLSSCLVAGEVLRFPALRSRSNAQPRSAKAPVPYVPENQASLVLGSKLTRKLLGFDYGLPSDQTYSELQQDWCSAGGPASAHAVENGPNHAPP